MLFFYLRQFVLFSVVWEEVLPYRLKTGQTDSVPVQVYAVNLHILSQHSVTFVCCLFLRQEGLTVQNNFLEKTLNKK